MYRIQWIPSKCCLRTRRHIPRSLLHRQVSTASITNSIAPALLERARDLAAQHAILAKQLNHDYDVQTAKKAGSLADVARVYNQWHAAQESLPELQQLIADSDADAELRSLATEEIESTTENIASLAIALEKALAPEHPFAAMPCLIEIRPGAGGDEAALFAGDLLRMYRAYCNNHGLSYKLLAFDAASSAKSSDEQVQEAVLEIPEPGSYETFRCEAGVHRVQRVPATETKGRTHTSAVSVLVLPSLPSDGTGDETQSEANFEDPENDYYINTADVRTDVMRASGAGGQHVNKTDSAVRLTHVPTNTVVSMQESRSQHQNRAKAWQILRARLAQSRREAREEEMAALRTSVVGVGRMGRGDKVRTYNWNQRRVTDHRSGLTVNRLDDVLAAGESLNEVMDSVRSWLKSKDLENMILDENSKEHKEQKAK